MQGNFNAFSKNIDTRDLGHIYSIGIIMASEPLRFLVEGDCMLAVCSYVTSVVKPLIDLKFRLFVSHSFLVPVTKDVKLVV